MGDHPGKSDDHPVDGVQPYLLMEVGHPVIPILTHIWTKRGVTDFNIKLSKFKL